MAAQRSPAPALLVRPFGVATDHTGPRSRRRRPGAAPNVTTRRRYGAAAIPASIVHGLGRHLLRPPPPSAARADADPGLRHGLVARAPLQTLPARPRSRSARLGARPLSGHADRADDAPLAVLVDEDAHLGGRGTRRARRPRCSSSRAPVSARSRCSARARGRRQAGRTVTSALVLERDRREDDLAHLLEGAHHRVRLGRRVREVGALVPMLGCARAPTCSIARRPRGVRWGCSRSSLAEPRLPPVSAPQRISGAPRPRRPARRERVPPGACRWRGARVLAVVVVVVMVRCSRRRRRRRRRRRPLSSSSIGEVRAPAAAGTSGLVPVIIALGGSGFARFFGSGRSARSAAVSGRGAGSAARTAWAPNSPGAPLPDQRAAAAAADHRRRAGPRPRSPVP